MPEPALLTPGCGLRRSRVGRADLLYVRQRQGQAFLLRSAGLLGFRAPEKRTEVEAESGDKLPVQISSPGAQPAQVLAGDESPKYGNQRFYRLLEREQILDEKRVTEPPARLLKTAPFTRPASEPIKVAAPAPPSLAPWRRIWPFLRAALGVQGYSRRLDLQRLINGLAQGRVFRRLPRLTRTGWAPNAQLIVDLDWRLRPFWRDFYELAERLRRLRGHAGLEILCFEEGPHRLCAPWEIERRTAWRPYQPPEPGTPVLILSDLGLLDGKESGWMALGRRLQARGIRPVALMPCPERYWNEEALELFHPVVWDRARRFPRKLQRPRSRPEVRTEERTENPGVARLLMALAFTVRVEPGLLRAVRARLPAGTADVGSEAAVWRHPDVNSDGLTFVLREAVRAGYAADLAQALAAERQARSASSSYAEALQLQRDFHASLAAEIGFEEEMMRAQAEGGRPDHKALAFMWRVASTLYHQPASYPYAVQLKAWVERLAERQLQQYWAWEAGEPMAVALALALLERYGDAADIEFPVGYDANRVAWALTPSEPQAYELRQATDSSGRKRLVLKTPGGEIKGSDGFDRGDVLIARVKMINNRLQWQQRAADGRPGRVHLLDIRSEREIPVPETGELVISGNFDQLTIDGMVKPGWANLTQGRQAGKEVFRLQPQDQQGLRLEWLRPGEYAVRDRNAHAIATLALREGCFADEILCREIESTGFTQPSWAERIGVDQYGLYADCDLQGINQRFRWIAPGQFIMGSPADEPERETDEKPHQVIFTQGIWLADTACNQSLWKAVMGENPSFFKGDERPVENVSWEDVQQFLQRINGKEDDLGFRLPTEAEWEYACRAATTAPFWFGANITPAQVNYHGEYPYADGEKGLSREETVAVKALPCNSWGLYQMHGNVWEWCHDWLGEYPDGMIIDPKGPETGGSRVLRGGSWSFNGGYCRSAYRRRLRPGKRSHYTGFRLARGRSSQLV